MEDSRAGGKRRKNERPRGPEAQRPGGPEARESMVILIEAV